MDDALRQLGATAIAARSSYAHVECKIFVRTPAPNADAVDLRGGRFGYRAIRIFKAEFPGEWILSEYDSSGNTHLVRHGSEAVSIVFGRH